jgi:hypothetical protein
MSGKKEAKKKPRLAFELQKILWELALRSEKESFKSV